MITLGPEKAVYSVLLPEVKELLEESMSEFYVHSADDVKLRKIHTDAEFKFREWVKDIVDLSTFPYGYPTNGATHGIDQWLLDNSSTHIQQGPAEYMWAKTQRPTIEVTRHPTSKMYLSNPYSASGNFEERHLTYNVPMLMDCAFVGTTSKNKITVPDNVEAITFSLSKGFSVNLFRIGFMFSRTPIPALQTLMSFNYFNLPAVYIADKILSTFPVDYLYNKLRKTQLDICSENDLTPADSVIIATSLDPKYDQYKRGNGPINRLCLSREYVKRGFGSFDLSATI